MYATTTPPRHEVELGRDFWRAVFNTIRHPSQFPAFCRQMWRDTRTYYAGEDVVDLEKAEIIEILAYARRVAIQMAFIAMIFLILAVTMAALSRAYAHRN